MPPPRSASLRQKNQKGPSPILCFWSALIAVFLVVALSMRSLPSPTSPQQATSLSTSSKSQSKTILRDTLLHIPIGAEAVWDSLVEEGGNLLKQNPQQSPGVAMEVGMHIAKQCLQAARAGLQAHCVEPSPISFNRVQRGVKRAPADVQSRVHLYQKAAGASSSGSLEFRASGSTGDHVGNFDVWNMVSRSPTEDGATIQVPSIRLDDIISNDLKDESSVFLLKVDVQGYEPSVLEGLSESLKQHKVQFFLFEYWPKGIDMMNGKENRECIAADLLQGLVTAGYTLYALPGTSHPKAPKAAKTAVRINTNWKDASSSSLQHMLPLHDLQANCRWYYQMEDRFPAEDYKMGYWSDILAVAPTAASVLTRTTPVTKLGNALANEL